MADDISFTYCEIRDGSIYSDNIVPIMATSITYTTSDGVISISISRTDYSSGLSNITVNTTAYYTASDGVFHSQSRMLYTGSWYDLTFHLCVFSEPWTYAGATRAAGVYALIRGASGSGGTINWRNTNYNIDYFPFPISILPPKGDPYAGGGTTTEGGGGRSFDDSSDPIPLPVLPTDPVLNSGFVTMYQMNLSKLRTLSNYLWSTTLFDINNWQKLVADPMDAIIQLTYMPVSPTVGTEEPIQIGNITTNINANPVLDQFILISFGELFVEEYSGSYLDYAPYTKVEIYLPYIGFHELNTDEVMNKTLTLRYNIDIVSGECLASILCENTVLYQFAGNCSMQIPVTGRDTAKERLSKSTAIFSGVGMVASALTGNFGDMMKAATSTADSIMQSKRNIQRSGAITGSAGFLAGQKPYLIITRPRQALPENQNHYTGYPSYITTTLGDISGMTFVDQIHLENIPCTSAEQSEIETLLKGGVIF